MPGAAYPLRMLQAISGHLRERGFRGNSEDYYDPGGGRLCWTDAFPWAAAQLLMCCSHSAASAVRGI